MIPLTTLYLRRIFTTASLGLLFYTAAPAQSVTCKATVEATRLSSAEQKELDGLAQIIEQYVQSFKYTDETYDVQFSIVIQVFIESVTTSGSEKIYLAQAVVSNNYDQRYMDKRWRFVYNTNDPLYHSGVFHPLTSFIDFYVYLVLGGAFDLIEPLLGSRYYGIARELASRGKVSNHPAGWTTRLERIDDITGNRRFRQMKGAYSDFMYFLYDERKPTEALEKLNDVFRLLEEIFELNSRERYTLDFLDAHKDELSKAILGFRRESLFDRLIGIDPENKETYETYRNKIEDKR